MRTGVSCVDVVEPGLRVRLRRGQCAFECRRHGSLGVRAAFRQSLVALSPRTQSRLKEDDGIALEPPLEFARRAVSGRI
jgi:hypothetical protein